MTRTRRTALRMLAATTALALTAPPYLAWPAEDRVAMRSMVLSEEVAAHLGSLEALRNSPVDPAALAGRAVMVNFFASWCPPCGPEAAILTKLSETWEPRGASFVSINLYEEFGGVSKPERLAAFLDRYAPSFPVVTGTDETAQLFGGVDRIPTLFLFRPNGVLQHLFVHERGSKKMRAEKEELEEALTRALG